MHTTLSWHLSNDRPPMLGPGRYFSSGVRFSTIPLTPNRIVNIRRSASLKMKNYSTVDACNTAKEMWTAIERLQQGESLNVQDVKTNMFWEFGKFTSRDGESMNNSRSCDKPTHNKPSNFFKLQNKTEDTHQGTNNDNSDHGSLGIKDYAIAGLGKHMHSGSQTKWDTVLYLQGFGTTMPGNAGSQQRLRLRRAQGEDVLIYMAKDGLDLKIPVLLVQAIGTVQNHEENDVFAPPM
ncbi:hypothetical protein Tco_0692976 [Tanacetum coccineum]